MKRFLSFSIVMALVALGGLAHAAEVDTPKMSGFAYAVPVKAATKIEAGTLVVLDSGYAAPGSVATELVAIGRAAATVDNTGGLAGEETVVVEPGIYRWANSAGGDLIAQAQVGSECYIAGPATVAATDSSGTRSPAGVVVAVDSDGVWVSTRVEDSTRGGSIVGLEARLEAEETATSDFESRISAEEAATATFTATLARRQVRYLGAPAAPADLHAAFAGGSGLIDVSTGFSAIPLPARQLQVVGSVGCATGVATVTGTDEAGAAQTEDFVMDDGVTSKGAKVFASVTRFQTDTDPGATETVTLQTGPGVGVGGPVEAIHKVAADGTVEAIVSSVAAQGLVEPTTAPDGTVVFMVQVTP